MPAAASLRRRWPFTLPKKALVSRISRFRRNKSRRRGLGVETARSEGYLCQFLRDGSEEECQAPAELVPFPVAIPAPATERWGNRLADTTPAEESPSGPTTLEDRQLSQEAMRRVIRCDRRASLPATRCSCAE